MTVIDLNSDLGESFGPWKKGLDEEILKIVSSANVACGFHAGDPLQMKKTCLSCIQNNVGIGAHPGFRDLVGFGRREIQGYDIEELKSEAIYQIGALQAIAKTLNTDVRHVKFHGALGNMSSRDIELAKALYDAVMELSTDLKILVIAGTKQQIAAEELGIPHVREIFADRSYNSDGTLVSRSKKGAMILDPIHCADNMLNAVQNNRLTSIDGNEIAIKPESICVHGDSPAAVNIAAQIKQTLENAGIGIEKLGTIKMG
ncbi:MAG: LamB/YcsF family protein [Rhodobacteraceae bacterium]|nr:LamB/YcsF family protein [Paracoccaceae bacterium]MCY4249914.1 LamB/YcsF family protein [Paracoccaceae bacterium]MCY4308182.1 LamB/YcsF family protein [Paracoccaceae bacterium]